jgi:hypothetical protein
MELTYYQLYLKNHLQSDFPELLRKLSSVEVENLLTERVIQATVTFENARREGLDIPSGQEMAVATLVQGLNFSSYVFLHDVLEREFKPEFGELAQQHRLVVFLLSLCATLDEAVQGYEADDTSTKRMKYNLIVGFMAQTLSTAS